jgi:hypothetical protein
MADARLEAERRRLKAAASHAHAVAEKALREHAAHVRKARTYFEGAEAKHGLSPAEIEKARAEIKDAEREVRATVRETLANIDAQTEEAISRLTRQDD